MSDNWQSIQVVKRQVACLSPMESFLYLFQYLSHILVKHLGIAIAETSLKSSRSYKRLRSYVTVGSEQQVKIGKKWAAEISVVGMLITHSRETSFMNQYIPVREIASDTHDVGWNSLITSGS